MAGLRFTLATDELQATTTKKTLLQIVAPATQRGLVKEITVALQGIAATEEPVLVEFLYQSTAGTGGDALTPVKANQGDDETIQTTAQSDVDGSTQPTDGDEAMPRWFVPPTSGRTWQAPFGEEIAIAGGDRLGIAVTAFTGSVGVVLGARCEE